ncbi:hypothetical protein NDU88_001754 [Pleurodeles waltl]|uniref:Uncharacterized protein n=1 Tax=Pleurodeles waltl TaxID=8319 RepID=A0AAV7MPM1_PLEWA|nr:hypothetical protein NDU88_001754 [Pleurodeles waltl]
MSVILLPGSQSFIMFEHRVCIAREAGHCKDDINLKSLGPLDPGPRGTVKCITWVPVEERADVWTHKEGEDGKGSRDGDGNGDWRDKKERDGDHRSEERADGDPSSEKSVAGDPRNEEKEEGDPRRRDEGSRTGEHNRTRIPLGRKAEARHVPGGAWLSQVCDRLRDQFQGWAQGKRT